MRKYLSLDFSGLFAEKIVELTDGFTGANLESTVRELAYRSIANDSFALNEENITIAFNNGVLLSQISPPILKQFVIEAKSGLCLLLESRLVKKNSLKTKLVSRHEKCRCNNFKTTKYSNKFMEIEVSGIMLGFVSICFFGELYEVHTLEVKGASYIIQVGNSKKEG